MRVYVVFAHPSRESFTSEVLDAFVRGLADAGHSVEVRDLYEMEFQADMDLAQYQRETALDPGAPVPADVEAEQSTEPPLNHPTSLRRQGACAAWGAPHAGQPERPVAVPRTLIYRRKES